VVAGPMRHAPWRLRRQGQPNGVQPPCSGTARRLVRSREQALCGASDSGARVGWATTCAERGSARSPICWQDDEVHHRRKGCPLPMAGTPGEDCEAGEWDQAALCACESIGMHAPRRAEVASVSALPPYSAISACGPGPVGPSTAAARPLCAWTCLGAPVPWTSTVASRHGISPRPSRSRLAAAQRRALPGSAELDAQKQKRPGGPRRLGSRVFEFSGGAIRSRTGLDGFAI
jgi:hypothetical protein